MIEAETLPGPLCMFLAPRSPLAIKLVRSPPRTRGGLGRGILIGRVTPHRRAERFYHESPLIPNQWRLAAISVLVLTVPFVIVNRAPTRDHPLHEPPATYLLATIGHTKAAVFDNGEEAPRKVQFTALYKDGETWKGSQTGWSGTVPILRSLRSKMGLSPSPWMPFSRRWPTRFTPTSTSKTVLPRP